MKSNLPLPWQRAKRCRVCKRSGCLAAGDAAAVCRHVESPRRIGAAGFLHELRSDGPAWSPWLASLGKLAAARKGHNMPDRPHRMAGLVEIPEGVQVVTPDAKPAPGHSHNGDGHHESRLDVARWLGDKAIPYKVKDRPDTYGRAGGGPMIRVDLDHPGQLLLRSDIAEKGGA